MKTVHYHQVSNVQLFIMSLLIGIIAAALITINIHIKDYLLLPEIVIDTSGQCVTVVSYKNGDAYGCEDVGIILREYRTKK